MEWNTAKPLKQSLQFFLETESVAGSGQEISGQLCRPAFGKFFLQVTKNNCTTKGLKGMENNEKYLVQQGESKKRSPIIKAFSNFLIFLLNSDSDRVTLRRLRQWVRVIQKSSSISPLWSASRISQSSSASILSMLMHSLRNLSNFQHLPTSVSNNFSNSHATWCNFHNVSSSFCILFTWMVSLTNPLQRLAGSF